MSRRERVKRQAMEVAETLQHLEAAGGDLSSYPSVGLHDYKTSSLYRTPSFLDSHNSPAATIYVCQGKHCKKRGSKQVAHALESASTDFDGSIEVKGCACLGQCKRGPAVQIDTKHKSMTYVDVNTLDGIKQIAVMAVLE